MPSIPDVTIEFVDRPDLLWAYADGLASVLLCAITAGARILLVPRFDPAGLADALKSPTLAEELIVKSFE